MAKCMIVTNGIADKKGKPSIEFYKNRKPQYYCLGYENNRMEEIEYLKEDILTEVHIKCIFILWMMYLKS
jgi:hypothetical protein